MFIYLSKKIAIPNGAKLHSLSWNPEHGWIAAGGDGGLLKVLKLDNPNAPPVPTTDGSRPAAASSNLSMNQTLDGHHGSVVCVTWNANHRKLTTSDQNGLIIVWMLHKGQWYEEMINNRNKSVVRAMKWTADGTKICIVYEDGAVIVGSVDGNRIWGKELDVGLTNVEWSPDSAYILFATADQELHMYDLLGNMVKSLPLYGKAKKGAAPVTIVAVDWYDGVEGHSEASAPTLAVAFDNGRVQLTRGTDDTDPIFVETKLKLRQCKWNTRGTVVAVAGAMEGGPKTSSTSAVKFYSAYGAEIRTLKVPGGGIQALTWEGGSLRIALAVEAYIYFANVRPDHQWAYFGDTVVVAYTPQERSGTALMFWDLKSGERLKKRANGLRQLRAAGEHCCLVLGGENNRDSVEKKATTGNKSRDEYKVSLRNSIGSPVESRSSPVEPKHAAMTQSFIVLASDRHVYLWQYAKLAPAKRGAAPVLSDKAAAASKAAEELLSLRQAAGRERVLDLETGESQILLLVDGKLPPQTDEEEDSAALSDPISSICCSDRLLLVARKSGEMLEYALPHLTLERRFSPKLSPSRAGQHSPWIVAYNCDATRLACVDTNGCLSLLEFPGRLAANRMTDDERLLMGGEEAVLDAEKIGGRRDDDDEEAKSSSHRHSDSGDDDSDDDDDDDSDDENYMRKKKKPKKKKKKKKSKGKESTEGVVTLDFERKDTWDVVWSTDDPTRVASMEKTKLCVHCTADLDNPEPSEACNGYLANFGNLKVKSVALDILIANPEKATVAEVIIETETQRLREVRDVLQSSEGGASEGYAMIESMPNPHPHLWRFLADASLESLDLALADKAFVRCHDYQGIQLVKRLRGLSDRMKQRAEVAAYFGRFEEAEQVYRDIDRKDLAIELRERLGDWARVAQLIQSNGGGGDDAQRTRAWLRLGDDHAARGNWAKAREYYEQSQDLEKTAQCYYRLDDFVALEKLLNNLPLNNNANHPLLLDLARKFESVGLHAPAVEAYLRANQPKMAVDCCVLLQQWGRAVELADDFGFQQIEGLLAKNSAKLLQRGDHLLAVELYRKANKAADAAILLAKIAEEVGVQSANPLRAKKLHVLAALEVERHRKKTMDQTLARTTTGTKTNIAMTTQATLDTLMTQDREAAGSSKVLDSAWRGAAAYHYLLLAHRQLYSAEMDAAMKTAIRLAEFEDVLAPRDVYSIIALAAYHNSDFNVCSRAFIKLETLNLNEPGFLESIQKLALTIFTKHEPSDHHDLPSCYVACLETGTPYVACTVTGRAVLDQRTILCTTCRHHALELELRGGTDNCPLCHSPYPAQYRVQN